jgi:uncharacterized protein YjiK
MTYMEQPMLYRFLTQPYRSLHMLLLSGCFAVLSCANTCSPPVQVTDAPVAQVAVMPIPYDLAAPAYTIDLKYPALQEISGLSPTKESGQLLCISDEAGVVYTINAQQNAAQVVIDSVVFRPKGDFEGVEMHPESGLIYAIKSDGKLFEIRKEGTLNVHQYDTPLTEADDIESLGYDPVRKRLLIVCKGDPETKGQRDVWTWDPATKLLSDKPLFSLAWNLTIATVPFEDGVDKKVAFSPSGIAVHPLTGHFYILSSTLKRLVIVDPNTGALLAAARLDKEIHQQPEGICFGPDGNLFVSNEAKKNKIATILVFPMRKQ